jgi:cytochrome c-type biogenesis protein CcmH
VLPLAVLGLYLVYGSPRLPDQPLTARLKEPASDQNIAALVVRVEARLREHPEEGEGWDVIAPVYLAGRRYGDAADAYAQAIRLLGPSAQRLSGYGQALVLEKGGVVSEEARRALDQALALDETLIEPRILIAISKEQDGKFAAAVEDWGALLDRPGGDERWRAMVQARVEAAEAHLSGKVAAPRTPEAPGPNAADVAAAQDKSPADRQAMIEGMVQRLAARLEQNGDDLAGWLRLVRAYTVLDRKNEALKALERARSAFAGNAQAIEQLNALAAELGLKS